jgi:hypothetical protein
MYTPEKAGVFGQHGWTEVYMGDAGWIPVDATAGETDYVDSGHIRIGAYASLSSRLNAQEFEILDYRIAGGTQAATEAAEERFAPYLGDYEQPDTSQKASIRIQDGSPVLDLQGKAMLALHPPDGDGRWRCKISRHLYAIFEGEGLPPVGGIHSFTLHETYSLPRRSVPESTDDAPPELRRCLGAYYMAALDADFVVGLRRGQLELQHPRQKRPWPLTRVEGGNRWKVPNTPYFIEFVEDEGGRVESLIFDAATRFRRRG